MTDQTSVDRSPAPLHPNPGFLTIEGIRYVTTAEAAEALGADVTTEMIRDWVKRGLLKSVGRYGGRSNIYRLDDVALAERRTRLQRRGRIRQAGELRKIETTERGNLPTEPLVDPAQKLPRCSVIRDNGRTCNRFSVPDAPFRICRDHMREAFLHWQDQLPEVLGMDPEILRARSTFVPRVDKRQPFVYYIRFGDRIKIGHSVDVRMRLANLPCDELLALEPGPIDLERMRHHQFAPHKVKGEWFHQHPDLLSHIAMLVDHFGPAEAQLRSAASNVEPGTAVA